MIGAHGSGDVLDLLLAEIVEGEIEAVAHLLVRRGTKANPARLSQRFEPGCDVDAVAEYIASLDDDVADIATGPTERGHQTARAGRYARRTRPQLQCQPRDDFTP